MAEYAKLFGSILDSSLMDEPVATRWLWTVMLAMKDKYGIVSASLGGLAHRARLSREEVVDSLARFMRPDEDSRTKDDEGRRIEEVDGGWRVINHEKYRDLESITDRRTKDAARQKRRRERLATGDPSRESSRDVTPDRDNHGIRSEADLVSVSSPPSPSRGSDPDLQSNGDARSGEIGLRPGPVTSDGLQRVFGAVRARDVGGFDWQGVRDASGKSSTMAEAINGEPRSRADVVPTMALLFKKAKAGAAGARSTDILREPSFAFGVWCSRWTALREELHGTAPPAPSARPVEVGHTDQVILQRSPGAVKL